MRFTARLSASLLAITVFAGVLGAARVAPAYAAEPYAVSIAAAKETQAPGETAVFRIRVDGQVGQLPTFDYDVQGGTLTGVASLDPTAANVAEGAIFVTRETAGTVTVNVRLGTSVLATGSARFAALGSVNVSVQLLAGTDAAARTWRYEVLAAGGQVVATLTANTSGDAPLNTVSVANLPYGFYTVRQVLGGDTRTACAAGAFYEVQSPNGAETTIELAAASAGVTFTIAPCPDIPDLGVSIPIDTIARPGAVGDADVLPGETPISEVRGTRQEGPGDPLPPAAGNALTAGQPATGSTMLILMLGAFALMIPGSAMLCLARGSRPRR